MRHRRRGLTLLELLLALALVVIIGAMILPAVERPFAAERLRRAGDQVRAHWGQARNRAIENGEVYAFRGQLGGGRYLVDRYAGADIEDAQAAGIGDNTTPQTQTGSTRKLTLDERLPQGVTVSDVQIEQDLRSSQQVMEFGTEAEQESRDEVWSATVLFFPDGSATTAQLTLANEYGATVLVSLRGLTGGSTLGEVQAAAPSLERSPRGQP